MISASLRIKAYAYFFIGADEKMNFFNEWFIGLRVYRVAPILHFMIKLLGFVSFASLRAKKYFHAKTQRKADIAKIWDGNQWIEVDNLNPGDIIDFFDSEKPFNEKVPNEIGDNNQPVCVLDRNSNPADPYVTIALGIKKGENCVGNYALKKDYDASVPHNYDIGDNDWDFEVGKSAGICVKGSGYYEANTSQLNRRNNITGPFDDAFVSFKIPKGNETRVIPYLPQNWFDTGTANDRARFSQIWFENFINAGGGPPPLDKKLNYSAFPILYSGKLRFLVEAISQTALLGRPMCLPFVLARCIVPLQ